MKQIYFTLALAITTATSMAQTDTISTSEKTHELQEVVVNSDVAMASAEKSIYLPTRKQRNAATDAVALLHHMMIPQLQIDPMSQSVKTLSGEEVAIFIDFMPAKPEDLSGMNTQNVKRVEIYDFPKDVRFHNQKHVVNFVMQRYEVGGYTKLTSTNLLISEHDFQTNNSVYSKLVFRRWTIDANLSDAYADFLHFGSETTTQYRLPDGVVTRTARADDGCSLTHRPSASLRATYNSEKIQIANRFEILYNGSPQSDVIGSVSYSPALFDASSYESRRKTASLTPTFTGDWYFYLPKDWSLSVSPQFQYSRNTQNRFYKAVALIENDIKEDATSLNWNIDLSKDFLEKHSISLSNYGMVYNSQLEYAGSTVSKSKQNLFVTGQGVEYRFTTEKYTLATDLVAVFQRNKVDGKAETQWYPVASVEGSYAPDKRHKLALFVNYNSSAAEDARLNPSVMQENELMYYRGNPALKNYKTFFSELNYSWMPSNTFTASAYLQHVMVNDYHANTYDLMDGGAAIIRNVTNAGDYYLTNIGANLTLRLFESKLRLNVVSYLSRIHTTGLYNEDATPFSLNLTANYSLGQFYFVAGYNIPKHFYDNGYVMWTHSRSFYYLTSGWGNARWKARLDLVNPFRTDWRKSRSEITTPLFTSHQQQFNISPHQRLTITLSYTFNYGKKVKQGNELKEAANGQSSIL